MKLEVSGVFLGDISHNSFVHSVNSAAERIFNFLKFSKTLALLTSYSRELQ